MLAFLKLAWPYLLAAALGAGGAWAIKANIDGAILAHEQTAHANDNKKHADEIALINAKSAKDFADALAKQQAAEGKVASVETQFNQEVAAHASDSLNYRAQLITGTQRLRVRVASCGPVSPTGESAASASGADGAATFADLYGPTASGAFKVAADDQHEIDKLAGLQDYVRKMQDLGYIGKATDK
ncbi:lysis system i-spanin subunit Rz [Paraburkholderia aspalathi]|uniref:lysis system i-spanin subunit Rz n=1 Tax=Paraburkholderia aspalathi TaxID=1324617 RepID=UPI0038B7F7A4